MQTPTTLRFSLKGPFSTLDKIMRRRESSKKYLKCNFTIYNTRMIKSFRHKGLRRLFEDDDGGKLPPDILARIRLILSALPGQRTLRV
jgi:hypothetical protein